jgi:hypothetical protein
MRCTLITICVTAQQKPQQTDTNIFTLYKYCIPHRAKGCVGGGGSIQKEISRRLISHG